MGRAHPVQMKRQDLRFLSNGQKAQVFFFSCKSKGVAAMLTIRLIAKLLRRIPLFSALHPRRLIRPLLHRYARRILRTELIRLAIDNILGSRIL